MLPGSSRGLVGWRRVSVPCVSPASTEGNFSRLLLTLRRRQSSSCAPSAPNSPCKIHFDLSDPLTTPAASSRLHWWSFPPSVPPVGGRAALGRTKRPEPLAWDDPQDLVHGTTVCALHIVFGTFWSPSAFLNQIISDVPPSPGRRLGDADVTSATVCSLSNYQPAAALSAGAQRRD